LGERGGNLCVLFFRAVFYDRKCPARGPLHRTGRELPKETSRVPLLYTPVGNLVPETLQNAWLFHFFLISGNPPEQNEKKTGIVPEHTAFTVGNCGGNR
jgi:hypothetical protein